MNECNLKNYWIGKIVQSKYTNHIGIIIRIYCMYSGGEDTIVAEILFKNENNNNYYNVSLFDIIYGNKPFTSFPCEAASSTLTLPIDLLIPLIKNYDFDKHEIIDFTYFNKIPFDSYKNWFDNTKHVCSISPY